MQFLTKSITRQKVYEILPMNRNMIFIQYIIIIFW